MSRVGKKIIPVPSGVTVSVSGQDIAVKGPKGALQRRLHESVSVEQQDGSLQVVPKTDSPELRKFYGLSRSLVNNMVLGVSGGFSKRLKLVGVGYRAQVQGQELNLSLGYSHPVIYKIPEGIKISVEKQTTIIVEGIDKELVGLVSSVLRSYREPEPYHGKGVRYEDEVIETKVGKASGKK